MPPALRLLVSILVLGLAVVAVLLMMSAGLGVRYQWWPLGTGFKLFFWAQYLGLAAAALALIAFLVPQLRERRGPLLLIALVLGLGAAAPPLEFQRRARAAPLIHDISTDTERPPQFVALLKLRAGAANPPAYPGRQTAEQQRQAYPDIQPLTLPLAPDAAFARARAAADAMGWEVVSAERSAGRIEAVATTFWFGFKDDIVIRVAPSGADSRIDVRSKSRAGLGDVGTNAKRIRAYLERLRQ